MKIWISKKKELTKLKTFHIGYKIILGKYTATCQCVKHEQAYNSVVGTFLLDQYLDKPYIYTDDLCDRINMDLLEDRNFNDYYKLRSYHRGLGFRLPYAGEIFGDSDFLAHYVKPDIFLNTSIVRPTWLDQWPLMKDRKNRIACREDEDYEWGWLMNESKDHSNRHARVSDDGDLDVGYDTTRIGVRPVFKLYLNGC